MGKEIKRNEEKEPKEISVDGERRGEIWGVANVGPKANDVAKMLAWRHPLARS